MPWIRTQNQFGGVRTPWTLKSELSWRKTHRLGGALLVLAGVAIIILGLISGLPTFVVVLPLLLLVVAVVVIYSYLVWKEDPESSSRRDADS